ncbi:MAG: hypothetical protein HYR94_14105 [Chloroflexi bacterium]|nr:hypothetical protein [Chloroflexota bacterium]
MGPIVVTPGGKPLIPPGGEMLFLVRLNFVAPQRRLVIFWLAYRWASLLLALGWLFLSADSAGFSAATLFWGLFIAGGTLFITLLSPTFAYPPFETACFLAIDLIGAAALLAFSGGTYSPYYWYVLSPLLAGALLLQWRGALWAAAIFTPLYLTELSLAVVAPPRTGSNSVTSGPS